MNEIRSCSWDEIEVLSRKLRELLSDSGYSPTLIVAIMRGGAVPATIMAHLLGGLPVFGMTIRTTVTDDVRSVRATNGSSIIGELPRLRHERVLVVDDVTNTGSTLRQVCDHVRGLRPSDIRSACLVWDTVGTDPSHILDKCTSDFYGAKWHAWVAFPWEGEYGGE